jgi:hypothetical protein
LVVGPDVPPISSRKEVVGDSVHSGMSAADDHRLTATFDGSRTEEG